MWLNYLKKYKFSSVIIFPVLLSLFLFSCTTTNSKDSEINANVLEILNNNPVLLRMHAKLSMDSGSDPSILDGSVVVSITDSAQTQEVSLSHAGSGLFEADAVSVLRGDISATLTIDASGSFGGPYSTTENITIAADEDEGTISFNLLIGTEGDTCADRIVAEIMTSYADAGANQKKVSILVRDVTSGTYLNPANYNISLTHAVGSGSASEVSETIDGTYIEHTFELTEDGLTSYIHNVSMENACSSVSFSVSEEFSKSATVVVDGQITVFSIDTNITSVKDSGDTVTVTVEIIASDSNGDEISVLDDSGLPRFDYTLTHNQSESVVVIDGEQYVFEDRLLDGIDYSGETQDVNVFEIAFDVAYDVESITLALETSATPAGSSSSLAATDSENHSMVFETTSFVTMSIAFTDSASEAISDGETISLYLNNSLHASCTVSSAICEITANLSDVNNCIDDTSCSKEFVYVYESGDYTTSLRTVLQNNTTVTGLNDHDDADHVIAYLESVADSTVSGLEAEFTSLIFNPYINFRITFESEGTAGFFSSLTTGARIYLIARKYNTSTRTFDEISIETIRVGSSGVLQWQVDIDDFIDSITTPINNGWSIYFKYSWTSSGTFTDYISVDDMFFDNSIITAGQSLLDAETYMLANGQNSTDISLGTYQFSK
ncbi:MAG: hypothetical protein ABIA04_13025 [Pseudomonadota bacterium]